MDSTNDYMDLSTADSPESTTDPTLQTLMTTPRPLTWDDATWILTSAFIIFTMQSGFGLLEAGVVSQKNEVNIMVKNAVDVIFGGITYWMYGYGLSFGSEGQNNAFCGTGNFFVDVDPTNSQMGILYATYIFQLSFATTATTIVSGAMAERTRLSAYIVFSFMNTVVYCIPAHWMWGEHGWLKEMNAIDIAGSGVVHLLGGVCALVAAVLLGPRTGRYDNGTDPPPMGNPANSLVGMFMLWWGWLGFNCGSTFGISGGKWMLAAKSAVTTINASLSGGAVGLLYSYIFRKRIYNISDLVNSVLGGLVSITAACAVISTWESLIVGAIGGLLCVLTAPVLDALKVDDPVGAFAVHGVGGLWGMLAVGFFVDIDPLEDTTNGEKGLFHGGDGGLLLTQLIACLAIIAWSGATSFILLFAIDKLIGLRLSLEEERLGTDLVEHGIGQDNDLIVYQHKHIDKDGRAAQRLTLRRPSTMGMHRTFSLTLPCDESPKRSPTRKINGQNGQVMQGVTNPVYVVDDTMNEMAEINESYKCQ